MIDDTHLRWRHGFLTILIADAVATLAYGAIVLGTMGNTTPSQSTNAFLLQAFLWFAILGALPSLFFVRAMLQKRRTVVAGLLWGMMIGFCAAHSFLFRTWIVEGSEMVRLMLHAFGFLAFFSVLGLARIATGTLGGVAGWAYLSFIWKRKMQSHALDLAALE